MAQQTDEKITVEVFNAFQKPTLIQKDEVADFLFEHLDQYGDPREHIMKAINFAAKEIVSFGGNIIVLREDDQVIGCVVLNETGMGGYIPENILVYIAIHKEHRGRGLGKRLMKEAMAVTKGDIALHVEANNPAKFLYEKVGFTNPYLEMRLKR